MAEHSGSSLKSIAHCNCGSLRAATVGEPITVATCFCKECPRRTGSAFGISTYWMQSNVELSGSVTGYVREGQEGRKVTYYFCPNCGSSVYWELDADRSRSVSLEGRFSIRISLPPLARYGNGPNQVGSRSRTRSISSRTRLHLHARTNAGLLTPNGIVKLRRSSQNTGARTVVMPRWLRCAIAPPPLIGRSEASQWRSGGLICKSVACDSGISPVRPRPATHERQRARRGWWQRRTAPRRA
jgi:hypothetical protein